MSLNYNHRNNTIKPSHNNYIFIINKLINTYIIIIFFPIRKMLLIHHHHNYL